MLGKDSVFHYSLSLLLKTVSASRRGLVLMYDVMMVEDAAMTLCSMVLLKVLDHFR